MVGACGGAPSHERRRVPRSVVGRVPMIATRWLRHSPGPVGMGVPAAPVGPSRPTRWLPVEGALSQLAVGGPWRLRGAWRACSAWAWHRDRAGYPSAAWWRGRGPHPLPAPRCQVERPPELVRVVDGPCLAVDAWSARAWRYCRPGRQPTAVQFHVEHVVSPVGLARTGKRARVTGVQRGCGATDGHPERGATDRRPGRGATEGRVARARHPERPWRAQPSAPFPVEQPLRTTGARPPVHAAPCCAVSMRADRARSAPSRAHSSAAPAGLRPMRNARAHRPADGAPLRARLVPR